MDAVLDLISFDEFLPLLTLICVLHFMGIQMAHPSEQITLCAKRVTLLALVGYVSCGILTWRPGSAGEYLEIVVRALLASALVNGVAILLFSVVLAVHEHTLKQPFNWCRDWRKNRRTKADQRRAHRETAKMERRQSEEHARSAARLELERRRAARVKNRVDREREETVDDARAEVNRFYEEHAPLLATAFPPALFRSQMQTKFPVNCTPEQAWGAAQELITVMLPMVQAAKVKLHSEEEEGRKREREAAEVGRARNAIARLTEWYENEKAAIEQSLPAGRDREDILSQLFDRYDQLIKETLREYRP